MNAASRLDLYSFVFVNIQHVAQLPWPAGGARRIQ